MEQKEQNEQNGTPLELNGVSSTVTTTSFNLYGLLYRSEWIKKYIEILTSNIQNASREKIEEILKNKGIWWKLLITKSSRWKPELHFLIQSGLSLITVYNIDALLFFCEVHGFIPVVDGFLINVNWREIISLDNEWNMLANLIRSFAQFSWEVPLIKNKHQKWLKELVEKWELPDWYFTSQDFKDILELIWRIMSFGSTKYASMIWKRLSQDDKFPTTLLFEKLWLDMALVLEDEARRAIPHQINSTYFYPAAAREDKESKTDMHVVLELDNGKILEIPVQFTTLFISENKSGGRWSYKNKKPNGNKNSSKNSNKSRWDKKISGIIEHLKETGPPFVVIDVSGISKNTGSIRKMYQDWRNNPHYRKFSSNEWNFPAFWYKLENTDKTIALKMKVVYVFFHLFLSYVNNINGIVTIWTFKKYIRQFAENIKGEFGFDLGKYGIHIKVEGFRKNQYQQVKEITLTITEGREWSVVGRIVYFVSSTWK